MKKSEGLFEWPTKKNGDPYETIFFSGLEIRLCKDCWNGQHPRNGCKVPECQCGCYRGKNCGLRKSHPPVKGCVENQRFPDVGSFEVK